MTRYCSYCSTDFFGVSEHCDSQEHKDNVMKDHLERLQREKELDGQGTTDVTRNTGYSRLSRYMPSI